MQKRHVRFLLKLLSVMLLMAALPAVWIFLDGLALVALGADGGKRDQAREVLMGDVLAASNRSARVSFLRREPSEAGLSPVINLAPSPPLPFNPARQFPSCDEPLREADTDENRFRIAMGYPYLHRAKYAEGEGYRLFANQVGDVRLSALVSCFRATPFGPSCRDWMSGKKVDDSVLLQHLLDNQALREEDGEYCWSMYPEIVIDE